MRLPHSIPGLVAIAAVVLWAGSSHAQSPIVRGFTPRTGLPGTLVKIIGEHLDGTSHVDFGGTPAEFRIVGGTHLKAVVPAGATSGPIRVLRGGDGTATTAPFVVLGAAVPEFVLAPPRPNPAAGAVAWSFTLPVADPARLTVFDLRGAEVRLLASGPHGAGEHRGTWDGADRRGSPVAPGLYFMRLEWAGRTALRRVVVVGR